MKRALTAALFSGLFVLAIPQGAFADHAPDHSGDCGAKTEKSAERSEEHAPEQQAPEEHRDGDHESHDDGTILF